MTELRESRHIMVGVKMHEVAALAFGQDPLFLLDQ
jgi:hypothetical protein